MAVTLLHLATVRSKHVSYFNQEQFEKMVLIEMLDFQQN